MLKYASILTDMTATMKLLHIDSSPLATHSISRLLSSQVVAAWIDKHPSTTVEYLDLVATAPAHLNLDALGFRLGMDANNLTDAERRENQINEQLVSQFLRADMIVVGAPMYNFSIPSQLKAWIDRVAQAGRTFRYTAQGPEGLAGGKHVVVISTRGGAYSANPALAGLDHQESYLQTVFSFFGISELQIVRAEGLGMGDAVRANAIAQAQQQIRDLWTDPIYPT